MTADVVFDFISSVADEAFSFTFLCFGYEITWYNLMFCALVFTGFFSILGLNINIQNERTDTTRNETRREKVREENRRKNAEIARHNRMRAQAKKDGVPLK